MHDQPVPHLTVDIYTKNLVEKPPQVDDRKCVKASYNKFDLHEFMMHGHQCAVLCCCDASRTVLKTTHLDGGRSNFTAKKRNICAIESISTSSMAWIYIYF